AGREHALTVAAGQTLLEAGVAGGAALPFSCAMGGCAACRVKLVAGEVAMDEPNCLTPAEADAGYVLTCVARPLTPVTVEVPG
ncbi:MAG: 2Fe-2S iron-sulfur cluster binding domain-containing protein, partial [Deltaproteobacteria bacterium]